MAKFKVLARCYVDDVLREPGEVIVVADDFPAAPHIEPMDDAAKASAKKAGKMVVPGTPEYERQLISGG